MGIFDNAITNAACVYLMKYLELPENVVFVFTGDEEHSMAGASLVCDYLKNKNKTFHTVVLDVTGSGFKEKADFTVENDFVYLKDKKWIECIIESIKDLEFKWKFIPADSNQKEDNPDDDIKSKHIIGMISKENLCYEDSEIEEAMCDETYEYDEGDISCFSFCLPCDAYDMHAQEGFGIRRKSYYRYIEVLYRICGIAV